MTGGAVRWSSILPPLMMGVAFIIVSMGLGGVFARVVLPHDALPPRQVQRQICDRVVSDLLTARDLVEVQRAGILVRELNCSVMRRMSQDAS